MLSEFLERLYRATWNSCLKAWRAEFGIEIILYNIRIIWPAPVYLPTSNQTHFSTWKDIITNGKKKPSCLRRLYKVFSYVYTRSAFFICWWKLFVKLWKWNEGQKNDSVEGAAYCLKMNFCRKTLIKQDRFTQNREEIV